eukprot:2523430-Heterocapsa_arctica.AAC.1
MPVPKATSFNRGPKATCYTCRESSHHARDCPHDHRAADARYSGRESGHHRTTCYNMRLDRIEQLANAGSGDSNEGDLMLGAFHNGKEYPEQLELLNVIVDSGAAVSALPVEACH